MTDAADSQAPNKRQAILDAAEKVFDRHGFAAATVDAVAWEADVAKGSIYNYFQSKQDLFNQVVMSELAAEDVAVADIIASGRTCSDELCQLLDLWYQSLDRYRRIGSLVLEGWASVARQQRRERIGVFLQSLHEKWRGVLAGIVAEGAETGEFDRLQDEPATAASLILALTNGAILDCILASGSQINEQFLEAFKRAMLSALMTDAKRSEEAST